MLLLVGSASLLALLLTLVLNADAMHRESVKRGQLAWIQGETLYLDEELERSFWQRFLQPFFAKLFSSLTKLAKSKSQNTTKQNEKNLRLQNDLDRAGIHMRPHEYIFLQVIIAGTMLIAGILAAFFLIINPTVQLLVLLFSLVVAILIPRYYLKSRIKSRQVAIQNQMPNIMDVLSVSIEAGLGFDAALLKVIERFHGPLIDELIQVHREVQMGMPRRESLLALSQRTNVPELKTFASAVVQSEQFGTPLKNVLRVQAQQLRVARRQMAQEKGMKAPVRMTLPMVLLIFPVIFIVLMGPTVINLIKQFG